MQGDFPARKMIDSVPDVDEARKEKLIKVSTAYQATSGSAPMQVLYFHMDHGGYCPTQAEPPGPRVWL